MVGHADNLRRSEALQSTFSEALESLWRSNFMTIKAVYIELRRSIIHYLHYVFIPNFIE
jgi:hypothetical protein